MRKVVFAVVAYFVFTAALSAVQTKPEAIYGTVRDSSGRPVSGVNIVLINRSTRARGSTATTNESGEYRVEVSPGSYDLFAVNGNFLKLEFAHDLHINANQTVKKDVTLPEVKPVPPPAPKGPLPEGAIPPPR